MTRIGPVNDLVSPAAASGGQLVEGHAQSQTTAFAESLSCDDGLVILRHGEEPRTSEGAVVAEDTRFVSRGSMRCNVLFELADTMRGEDPGESFLVSRWVANVDSSSVCGVFDLAVVGSEHVHKLLDLRGSKPNCVQLFLRIIQVIEVGRRWELVKHRCLCLHHVCHVGSRDRVFHMTQSEAVRLDR